MFGKFEKSIVRKIVDLIIFESSIICTFEDIFERNILFYSNHSNIRGTNIRTILSLLFSSYSTQMFDGSEIPCSANKCESESGPVLLVIICKIPLESRNNSIFWCITLF